MARRELEVRREKLRLAAPFRISGYVFEETEIVLATISEDGRRGRGEAAGAYYLGDDGERMVAAIESARTEIEAGIDRAGLQVLMPPGGGRNAVDCALWELEAAQRGTPAWRLAGLSKLEPVVTTFTLGADDPDAMAGAALDLSRARAIKVKLTGDLDLDIERVRRIRAARPDVWLGVDANQGFSLKALDNLVAALAACNVALLEQPLPRGREADLEGYASPIPIAADESALTLADVDALAGRFDVFNIKLDKCGGLTEALAIVGACRAAGLKVMVGNMVGTSLAMAPAFIAAQLCDFVDLDGPTFLVEDRKPGVVYEDGKIWCGDEVWGSLETAPA